MMEATRSAFIKSGAALVVTFGLPSTASAAMDAAGSTSYAAIDPAQLDSWIAMAHDGTVTYYSGRIDFGQHKGTAFSQIVAEELDVPFSAVTPVLGDTMRTPNQGASTASNGLLDGAKPLRHAAAEARMVLLGLAAQRLQVPLAQLVVSDGVVSVADMPAKSISYADLIGGRHFQVVMAVTNPDSVTVDVHGSAKLKDPSQYKIVGKPIPAGDIAKKVVAKWPRVHNVRLPGMLHARLVLPPVPGAHVAKVGTWTTAGHEGVRVIREGDFIAVVARTEWAAVKAADALDVKWTTVELPHNDAVFGYLRNAPPVFPESQVFKPVGDIENALREASKIFTSVYNYPAQNHGMIGPSCGVADARDGGVVAYAGTQDPPTTRAAIAKLLQLSESKVRVVPVEPSGCYGRLGVDDATVAAAYLSKKIGKPVRVQLMRAQEHVWEPVQQPSSFTLRAGIDATGKVTAWDQQEWSWGWAEDELPLMLVPGANLKADTIPHYRQPGGGETSSYAFSAMRGRAYTSAPHLRGTSMRSPGRIQINFAGEQFLDEIAAATAQDPIAFRLRHTVDRRTTEILQRAVEAAKWESRPSPSAGARSTDRIAKGRGIAVVSNQRNTYVATVAEVEVDRQTGAVAVKRMVVVVDPGIVVNPDGIRAQIEGATIYGTSRALKEEVTYDGSKVTSKDWISYPILRFSEVPEIEITLIDRKDLAPGGIGEPPNTTPAAAIGNAIFDALGVRLRELPFTPQRIKAALAQA